MNQSRQTTDHEEIREWAEARGRPSARRRIYSEGEGGLLRIDFGEKEAELDEIPWDEFFKTFEERKLTFLYQEKTKDGAESRFFSRC